MTTRYVHPFPARMAPQIALDALDDVPKDGTVLDPMCGSGTVLRAAVELGLSATGRDVDPLAVLMSRVATTPIDGARVVRVAEEVIARAGIMLRTGDLDVKSIDGDAKAREFVRYWFAPEQERQLRALTRAVPQASSPVNNLLRLAISRTIVTKDHGASLARDVSHSRPHRVTTTNSFDVISAFRGSVSSILRALDLPESAAASVRVGDARALVGIDDRSISAVVTSPPYLNAIDYIRGHRLALVWLGVPLARLTQIRSESIGAERAPDADYDAARVDQLISGSSSVRQLEPRFQNMFRRFAADMDLVLRETSRVLEPGGRAVFVMGNSTLRGVFVDNAAVVRSAAGAHGLALVRSAERELPARSRYLPPPGADDSPLARRMRTEVVFDFVKPPG